MRANQPSIIGFIKYLVYLQTYAAIAIVCGLLYLFRANSEEPFKQITAELSDAAVSYRTVNGVEEKYIRVTYDYIVKNKEYLYFVDYKFYGQDQAERDIAQLKEHNAVITLYYDERDPWNCSPTETSDSSFVIVQIFLLCIMGYGMVVSMF